MPFLTIQHLHKSYPDGWTLANVSFSAGEGEILCLLGPSGCGKTTLLRLIAGLETPDGGQVLIDGEDVTLLPPHLRGFGLMFQEYALFPHKDVFGNVSFGLRMAGQSRETTRTRVREVLELVGLSGFEHRDVNQLSGGERQRVALARSLAPQPRLLMLDEPLGALDRALRERLLEELPTILKRVGVTTITVTHDQEEAFAIADRVVVMRDGQVVQQGTPEEVYRHPASSWVARFLGLTNLLEARMAGPGRVETALGVVEIEGAKDDEGWKAEERQEVLLLIRPEAARPEGDGHGTNANMNVMEGTVTEHSFRGSYCRLSVRHESGVELCFALPSGPDLPGVGRHIRLSLDPKGMSLLPAASG